MKFLLILVFLSVSACSLQEATDADHHSANDGYVGGPGVLSGGKGAFSVSEIFSSKSNAKGVGGATAYDVDLPAMDQKSFGEYERFKKWSRSQQSGSAEAREYQEWKEFQEYRRYKLDESKAK
jgi:hypothetical protein